jgi:hypothetical protein
MPKIASRAGAGGDGGEQRRGRELKSRVKQR